MGIGTANQGRVNKPAGQWEPGGKDATLMPNPPPQLESCLRGQGGEGNGGEAGKTDPGYSSARETLKPSRHLSHHSDP